MTDKEIIKQAVAELKQVERPHASELLPAWWVRENNEHVDKALALLDLSAGAEQAEPQNAALSTQNEKAESPAGEFKNKCLRLFSQYKPKVDFDEARAGVLGNHPFALLVEACDRLDAQQLLLNKAQSDMRILQAENAKLKDENKRLGGRDGNASIEIIWPGPGDPFHREQCKVIDFSVSDNGYVIESPELNTLFAENAKLVTQNAELSTQNASHAERIKKLEIIFKHIKQIARRGSRSDIFRMAQKALAPAAANPDETTADDTKADNL